MPKFFRKYTPRREKPRFKLGDYVVAGVYGRSHPGKIVEIFTQGGEEMLRVAYLPVPDNGYLMTVPVQASMALLVKTKTYRRKYRPAR